MCVCALSFHKSKWIYQKHFTNDNGIYYKFNWLRPSNISLNIVFFLQTMAINSNLTAQNGFLISKNMAKMVSYLILMINLDDICDFHVPVAAILDCS